MTDMLISGRMTSIFMAKALEVVKDYNAPYFVDSIDGELIVRLEEK